MPGSNQPSTPAPDASSARALVLASLEEDQLVAAKKHRLARHKLGPAVRVLLWALRIYVLAMVAVVAYVLVHGT